MQSATPPALLHLCSTDKGTFKSIQTGKTITSRSISGRTLYHFRRIIFKPLFNTCFVFCFASCCSHRKEEKINMELIRAAFSIASYAVGIVVIYVSKPMPIKLNGYDLIDMNISFWGSSAIASCCIHCAITPGPCLQSYQMSMPDFMQGKCRFMSRQDRIT